MFDSTSYQQAFFDWLDREHPFLFVSENSDFKRFSFLNDVLSTLDQQRLVYFRLNPQTDLMQLVDQMTERFFIPVRSVNVDVLRQLQDQLAMLSQMKQRVIWLVEEAHQLSPRTLGILLALVADQNKTATLSMVLLGRPALEKRLRPVAQFLKDENSNTQSLSKPLSEKKVRPHSFYKGVTAWVIKKRIRVMSLVALLLLGVFLWQFKAGHWQPNLSTVQIRKDALKESSLKESTQSELKDALFYLKSIGDHWQVKLSKDPLRSEILPMLPVPGVLSSPTPQTHNGL